MFRKALFMWSRIPIFCFIGYTLTELFRKPYNWRQIYKRTSSAFYTSKGKTKLCHHPPWPSTTQHHPPPSKIYPPRPTTAYQSSTTTQYQPEYIHHHPPPAIIYRPLPTTSQKMDHHSAKAKINLYITSFRHCFNSFFFFEM